MNEVMAETCFSIISSVGMAKSYFIESIGLSKNKEYDKAIEMIEEGENLFKTAHGIHMDMVQKEARGEDVSVSLLLVHAEDQLMNAETFKILAYEFVELYKKVNENE